MHPSLPCGARRCFDIRGVESIAIVSTDPDRGESLHTRTNAQSVRPGRRSRIEGSRWRHRSAVSDRHNGRIGRSFLCSRNGPGVSTSDGPHPQIAKGGPRCFKAQGCRVSSDSCAKQGRGRQARSSLESLDCNSEHRVQVDVPCPHPCVTPPCASGAQKRLHHSLHDALWRASDEGCCPPVLRDDARGREPRARLEAARDDEESFAEVLNDGPAIPRGRQRRGNAVRRTT